MPAVCILKFIDSSPGLHSSWPGWLYLTGLLPYLLLYLVVVVIIVIIVFINLNS